MSFSEARQQLLRDFLFCVQEERTPPLGQYMADYVRSGDVAADDYRLFPITASALGWLTTSSDCLTDCMIELQSKYEEQIADTMGGHTERGWRELGVVGFNVLEGPALDILAIEETTRRRDWAEPKLASIDWERVLLRALVDFGRYVKVKQISLLPADLCLPPDEIRSDPARLDAFQAALKRRHDYSASAFGFEYDESLCRFVLNL